MSVMKLENIIAARRTKPFKPFSLHTGSGESYLILHPENMATHEQASMVLLFFGPGEAALLDLDNITEITYQPRIGSAITSDD